MKMRVMLAYGKTGLEVDLPVGANVTVIEPRYIDRLPDEAAALRQALRRPTAAPPLRQLVDASHTVSIVFSDITRATPNHVILPVLLEELSHVPREQVVLFNSTGTHRANTESELRGMLGDAIVDRYRIVQNDCEDRESHVQLGTTKGGNDIWVHREFVACDRRLLTGFIEPHFFAGFSGGGKAVMPGLALLETVVRNHGAENIDSPLACWGITEGNPLWEDVRDAAAMAEPSFLLNVTLNRDQQITGVFAGDWQEAHAQGCAFAKQTAMSAVPEPFDIVITSNSGYPLDLNVYQAVKGMSAAAQIVRPGGSIIVAADCWDGIPDHGEYASLLQEAENVEQILEMVRDPDCDRQDRWQAHIQALISRTADVYFHSHNLSDEQIRSIHLLPCRDIERTVAALLGKYGNQAKICVLPEGPQSIPYVA
jgi:nickel-dependent lactate racemase